MTDEEMKSYAVQMSQDIIITDGHIDFPYRLVNIKQEEPLDIIALAQSSRDGNFDYERAVKGGLNAPFMSIYIPSYYQQRPDQGKALADSLIDMVRYIATELPDQFALAGSPDEVEKNVEDKKISLLMGMENGTPIGTDLSLVKYFFDRGIRYITLTHAKDNQFCDSSYDTVHTHQGLSPLGRQLVQEMNRVGIMIDISHVDDSTFYQVMRLSRAPCIASHSSCRHFTPGFVRNMDDDMIKTLADRGGVIQINFGSGFLDGELREKNKNRIEQRKKWLRDQGLQEEDEEAEDRIKEFNKNNPYPISTVEKVADHIDHVVQLTSIDHVGLGSDFDGVGDSLPKGLEDVSQYPNLIYVLLQRGYTPEDIKKIGYQNVWRVWNEVIQTSATPIE